MTGLNREEGILSQFSSLAVTAPEHIKGEEDPMVRAANNHIRSGGMSPSKSTSGCVAYVVLNGRVKGVHYTWYINASPSTVILINPGSFLDRESCCHSVSGFPNKVYRGYKTVLQAEEAWREANEKGIVGDPLAGADSSPAPRDTNNAGDISRMVQAESSSVKHESSHRPTEFPSPSRSPSLNPRQAPRRQYWWVVLKGVEPGVYISQTAAREAAGTHPLVRIERMGNEDRAQQLWTTALGTGHVTLLPAA
ncbi:hypothetical protein VNI00_009133 [Paramarasmius palmivorus]|uniref:Uncharacterized protein n=1 Tax=Paramarasmius palmivorus TaxID=297713 RepID=A0AAW0AWV8_9AGAR